MHIGILADKTDINPITSKAIIVSNRLLSYSAFLIWYPFFIEFIIFNPFYLSDCTFNSVPISVASFLYKGDAIVPPKSTPVLGESITT